MIVEIPRLTATRNACTPMTPVLRYSEEPDRSCGETRLFGVPQNRRRGPHETAFNPKHSPRPLQHPYMR
jgi:hypothetical protein